MQVILKLESDGRLAPAFEEGEEWLRKKPPGKHFKANLKSSRNPGHHRKAFALLKLVLENQDTYETIEDLLVEFKLKSGHYAEHITTKGVLIYVPKSIAFDEMGQEEFEELYEKWIDIAVAHFSGPGMNYAQLRREVAEFGN